MLPLKLLQTLAENDVDDCNLCIIKAEHSEDILKLNIVLNIHNYNGDRIIQKWILEVSNPLKTNISFEPAEFIEIKDDHPLLWEFTDIQSELYYSGQCKDRYKLFSDLFSTHNKLFHGYLNFDLPFAEWLSSPQSLQYTNGLLAKGSKKLMEEYAGCLKANGINYSIVGEYSTRNHDLKVLIIGGSYVIAKNFSFAANE